MPTRRPQNAVENKGVSVAYVPDMWFDAAGASDPELLRPTDLRGGGRDEQSRQGRADLLLHQPAERPVAVLPRPRLGHHPPERLCRRGRALPDPGPDRERSDRRRRRSRRPGHRHPAGHPGQDLRAEPRAARRLRRDLGYGPLGRRGQPVAAARLLAGAEPGRHLGRQPVRPVGLWPLVLAAHRRTSPTGRSPTPTTIAGNLRPRCELVRAADDARHAVQLHGYGGVPRHAAGQRQGLPHRHAGPRRSTASAS